MAAADADANRFAERTCSICLEEFKNPSETGKCLPCGHWYCNPCVARIPGPDRKCPDCRRPIELPGLVPPQPVAPRSVLPLELIARARNALHETLSYMPGTPEYIKPRRCRMWRPAEPARPGKVCGMPATGVPMTSKTACGIYFHRKQILREEQPNLNWRHVSHFAREPSRPAIGTYTCQAMIGMRQATPLRQCALLADNRETGLCRRHCEQVLGMKSVPHGYRKNASDEERIKAFIESVRGSSSSSSSSSSAVNNLK